LKYSYNVKKTDANHAEIIAAFRSMGAFVKDVHDLPEFVDCIVFFRGQVTFVEIKDGTLPPSKRKLTTGELDFKHDCEAVGGNWALVESLSDATLLLMPDM